MDKTNESNLDFSNTEIAFSNKSNKELKKMARLFQLMNKVQLVNVFSSIGLFAVKYNLPFAKWAVKQTIFEQFVGGENLLDCQPAIEKLYKYNTQTVLDYGAEGKSTEEELDHTMSEMIKAIEFAASNASVPCVSTKITGLVDNIILEKLQEKSELTSGEQRNYEQLKTRINNICSRAHELGVAVFIDAEESWIQDAIDDIANEMMELYNKDKVTVYNTFQMYRVDKLQYLKDCHAIAKEKGYMLGAKLVRGAYMEKERTRAKSNNYPSPINPNKEATDDCYNKGIVYCLDHYEEIGFCNASHNQHSNRMLAELIEQRGLLKSHAHINFCQLYGMSDFITFNLAENGFNVAKYMPYGPVGEVFPYLVRRAQENTTVTGDVSRELGFIQKEIKRREI